MWSMGVIVAGSIVALVLAFLALVHALRRRELEMATNLALKHEAESANRAKSAFLAGMSHELRTPLTAVLGYAELLSKRAPDPFSRECATQIASSGGHLLGLLNDLLDLAKVEAGRVDVHPAPFAVAEVVAEVAGLHAASAVQKGLALTTAIGADVPATIVSDRVLLRQVLTNLVSNAIKFTDSGSVALTVSRAGDRVVFAVADTGPGVAPELSDVIFELLPPGQCVPHAPLRRNGPRARAGEGSRRASRRPRVARVCARPRGDVPLRRPVAGARAMSVC
jgi:signal transduction histidine kinase